MANSGIQIPPSLLTFDAFSDPVLCAVSVAIAAQSLPMERRAGIGIAALLIGGAAGSTKENFRFPRLRRSAKSF